MRQLSLAWTVALAFSLGCNDSGGSSESGIATGPFGPPTGDPPPSAASCNEEPIPETFELVNVGDSNLYVQLTDFTGGTSPLSLAHEDVPVTPANCAICSCTECPSCAICSRWPTAVLALGPGQSHSLTWNGYDYPILPVDDPGNACDVPCNRPCPLGPGSMKVEVAYGDWFSLAFVPDVTRQGVLGFGQAELTHPSDVITRLEMAAPPTEVVPRLTATTPSATIETSFVVASLNPSDEGGLELAALYGSSEEYGTGAYVAMFAPAELGTHALSEDDRFRQAVYGEHGGVPYGRATVGTVTLDVLTEEIAEGSFEFEGEDGTWSGTFSAPLRGPD